MKKKIYLLNIVVLFFLMFGGRTFSEELTVVRQTSNGALCRLEEKRNVLFLKGTASEMGEAHGELLKSDIEEMYQRILLVSSGYTIKTRTSFSQKIKEIERRTRLFIPERFFVEMAAMSKSAQIKKNRLQELNFFPELFHCSGIVVGKKATKDGLIRQVRVLDYMRDIGLQNNAVLIVYMPNDYHAWVSVSYAGFIGTVTAMNDQGLVVGEMGGRGEGKWDGIPMAFLLRRIMEECATVDQAIELMKSVPLTCDYYYIISDKNGNMAGIKAIAESSEPVVVFRAGEKITELPGALDDIVYISGQGERAETLFTRLKENYGKIDIEKLIETIKRPVSMKSNLHNAIFEPQTLNIWFAEAGKTTPACDEYYFKTNLHELLNFWNKINIL